MRIRAFALIAVVAAAATAAPAVAATSSTHRRQIRDGAGDWAVPSQDILDGTVTANAKTITAIVRMASAPVPGVVTDYAVTFIVGCKVYVATYRWTGVPQTESASFAEYPCPAASSTPVDLPAQPTATYPATASVSGPNVRLTVGTLPKLRPGVRIYAAAFAQTSPATVSFDTDPSKSDIGGDIAFSTQFVLGK